MARLRSRGTAYWFVLFGLATGLTTQALSQDASSSSTETRPPVMMTASLPPHPLPQPSASPEGTPPAVKAAPSMVIEGKQPAKTVDKKFVFVTSYSYLSTVLDIESTHNAITNCGLEEKNPLLGSSPSRAKMYGINIPITTGFVAMGYWLKKKYPNGKSWMILPVTISGTHTFGYVNNFARCGP